MVPFLSLSLSFFVSVLMAVFCETVSEERQKKKTFIRVFFVVVVVVNSPQKKLKEKNATERRTEFSLDRGVVPLISFGSRNARTVARTRLFVFFLFFSAVFLFVLFSLSPHGSVLILNGVGTLNDSEYLEKNAI